MKKQRLGLSIIFSLTILATLFVTFLIVGLFALILSLTGLIAPLMRARPLVQMLLLIAASFIVGSAVTPVVSRKALRPVRDAIRAVNEMARGDFSVRLDFDHPPEMAELAESFNRMAEELGNTELLRKDFVNSFSHEFKTPIVSIKGFAEMLKYEDLTEAERNEYLDVIILESGRLSELAMNVLNLSRVENQAIVTEKTRFNAGEQLRKTVILLQSKWESKEQDVSIDGEDVLLYGSEDLMGQVWLNLLDNAVKFAPEGGQITVTMEERDGEAVFMVKNTGPVIPSDKLERIFDRFYQGDTSHATAGNGLGLTLVKRIVELHGGTVSAESGETQGTIFTVSIPRTDVR